MRSISNRTMDKWQKVLPNYQTYPYPQFRQDPLYFVQMGNALIVKVANQTYTFEINLKAERPSRKG